MFDHGQPSYADVNKDILSTMLETGPRYWMLLFGTMSMAGILFFMPWIYQLFVGVGAAGMNRNAVWASGMDPTSSASCCWKNAFTDTAERDPTNITVIMTWVLLGILNSLHFNRSL